ncbi:unnamed protein product, partial [Discosporangium mesarthrocarpum]
MSVPLTLRRSQPPVAPPSVSKTAAATPKKTLRGAVSGDKISPPQLRTRSDFAPKVVDRVKAAAAVRQAAVEGRGQADDDRWTTTTPERNRTSLTVSLQKQRPAALKTKGDEPRLQRKDQRSKPGVAEGRNRQRQLMRSGGGQQLTGGHQTSAVGPSTTNNDIGYSQPRTLSFHRHREVKEDLPNEGVAHDEGRHEAVSAPGSRGRTEGSPGSCRAPSSSSPVLAHHHHHCYHRGGQLGPGPSGG